MQQHDTFTHPFSKQRRFGLTDLVVHAWERLHLSASTPVRELTNWRFYAENTTVVDGVIRLRGPPSPVYRRAQVLARKVNLCMLVADDGR